MNRAIPPDFEADIQRAQQLEKQRQQDPLATVALIQLYSQMLDRLSSDEYPTFYASLQNNLGLTYRNLVAGDHTANLQQAIACYQEALRIWTPETAPLNYAMTQHNLGVAYRSLLAGDRTANLARAISCYQQALRFRTPETDPSGYASTWNNLGVAYADLLTGNRTANLERAIACYQEALRIWTPETAPLNYAMTQNNLGVAYRDMPIGNRVVNLEHAIACFEEALHFWTPKTVPLNYARAQHNLGLAYNDLPTGDQVANLERAIACYQEALRFRTPEAAPLEYALTQNNLGMVYRDLPTGDRTVNLKRAAACLEEALRFRTPETAPLDYASTQNNLGLVYSELLAGDRTANLERAIACFQEALRFRTPETAPLDYAGTQNNLGAAFRNLPTGDRTANLERAIACYKEALHFWTPETAPLDYALTQNNLGVVYRDLPAGNYAVNLERAIACFREALRFYTSEAEPLSYAMAQYNLGGTYWKLPVGDRAVNLERAITCYQEALRFYTLETAPFNYALTQHNLGVAYRDLLKGDQIDNLERAIACFQEALRICRPEIAPLDYAMTQNNLGLAYWKMPLESQTTHPQKAIACFEEALHFYTPEASPTQCRMTNRNIANVYFAQQEWKAALRYFRTAMEVGERLYQAGLSVESKAVEIRENAFLYHRAAFAALRCGEPTEAFFILEQGKTRLLTEALRLRIARPASVPDTVWKAFEEVGAAVRAAQADRIIASEPEHTPLEAYTAHEQKMRTANAALDAAIQQVRLYAPAFLQLPDVNSIQPLLADGHTALITFCLTEQGSMGLIMGHRDQHIDVTEIPTFMQADLRRLLVEWNQEGEAVGGWLGAYQRYQRQPNAETLQAWQHTITRILMTLGQALLLPILSTLPSQITRLIFLPSAELFLFPLHAIPLSHTAAERVGDRYQVSYAPSIEVLLATRAKTIRDVTPSLYATINPEADPQLLFTLVEGQAIAQLFAQHQVDEGRVGTKEKVIAGVHERSYVHFSCHGSYNWNDPTASALFLADGELTLAELQQGVIDLSSARLVTLSACETGISDVLQGSPEEYVGVPAGFLLAGVPCVVSSLWAVPDLSTALIMERFYSNHVQNGMEFPAALGEAQRWLRQATAREMRLVELWERVYQNSGESDVDAFRAMRYYRSNPEVQPFAHPYYWAAFTVNGM